MRCNEGERETGIKHQREVERGSRKEKGKKA